jgi:DNA-binding GntR family transcriptional regulator
MRPPSPKKYNNEGGATYRRIAKRAASPTLNRLSNQLEELRRLNKTGNRGNMIDLYNAMNRKSTRASNIQAAMKIMNKAQKIMWNAKLLIH